MRRMLFVAIAGAALLAVIPATALARHGHHQRSHSQHARRQSRVHHKRFGSDTAAPGHDTAGTIASFSDGLLTIRLNDGSTVSGRVTDATEMECEAPDNENLQNEERGSGNVTSSGSDDNGGGDDNSGSDDNDASDDNAGNDDNDDNDDQTADQDANERT